MGRRTISETCSSPTISFHSSSKRPHPIDTKLSVKSCPEPMSEDDTIPHQVNQKSQGTKFQLSKSFVNKYITVDPPFGFNGLGELVYLRTYARIVPNTKRKEKWYETIERVVNGTYTMQKKWILQRELGWKEAKAQRSAQEMYERMYEMKFLPPGRGLWAMGTPLTENKGLYAALNNCAFVTTAITKGKTTPTRGNGGHTADGDTVSSTPSPAASPTDTDISAVETDEEEENYCDPYCFLMDAAMLGIGVGFDTKGAEANFIIQVPDKTFSRVFTIPDTREGWVESLRLLLEGYFYGKPYYRMDYSAIRPAGLPIKGFGGVSSGSQCLEDLHERITQTLNPLIGKVLTIRAIVDMMNHIGVCVVSGNVRRTAEIAFGDPENMEYIDLKNYEVNPDRMTYGWTSNNTVFASLGMNYHSIAERIAKNGEPGLAWLENMQMYGRMTTDQALLCQCQRSSSWSKSLGERSFSTLKSLECCYCSCGAAIQKADPRAQGGNPCLEQTLEPYEICCLVEVFPAKHKSLEDFLQTLKYAYLYAKTVTLGQTHWKKTNRVMLRNRRIGCSLSGIAQFIALHGLHTLRQWCLVGYKALNQYDTIFSDYFAIPKSIKRTSIKPSGTVSLLAGATPGLHSPESRYYLRRVRVEETSPLLPALEAAGYEIEKAIYEKNTMIVAIPIDMGEKLRTLKEISMWEQLALTSFLQKYWADNQVSCTITFDPEREGMQIPYALDFYQYQLKGISFLPRLKAGAYPQMPYEEITMEEYERISKKIQKIQWENEEERSFTTGAVTATLTAIGMGTARVTASHEDEEEEEERHLPDKYCSNDTCSF